MGPGSLLWAGVAGASMPTTLLPEGLEPSPWPARAAPHGHRGQQQTDRWMDGWTGMEGLDVGGLRAGSQSGSPDPRGHVLRARGRGQKLSDHAHLGGPVLTVLIPLLCSTSYTCPPPAQSSGQGSACTAHRHHLPPHWTETFTSASCPRSEIHPDPRPESTRGTLADLRAWGPLLL